MAFLPFNASLFSQFSLPENCSPQPLPQTLNHVQVCSSLLPKSKEFPPQASVSIAHKLNALQKNVRKQRSKGGMRVFWKQSENFPMCFNRAVCCTKNEVFFFGEISGDA